MSKRLINEFARRVNKAKNYLQDLNEQCESLRQETDKLKKELNSADNENQCAQKVSTQLNRKLLSSKANNEEGTL